LKTNFLKNTFSRKKFLENLSIETIFSELKLFDEKMFSFLLKKSFSSVSL